VSYSLTVKTQPTVEPVSLAQAKAHLRVDTTDDDALILAMIQGARAKIESVYDISYMTQSLVLGLDRFVQPGTPLPSLGLPSVGMYGYGPGGTQWGWMAPTWSVIELRPPVQSITSITYTDPTGAIQTLAASNYVLDKSIPGRVFPALNKIWPVTALLPGVISIEFVSGYTDPSLVPPHWKSALLLTLGTLYENREQSIIGTRLVVVELPEGVETLLGSVAPNIQIR
jgi:hypothetical protein